jgi:hypothetical protein
MCMAPGWCIEPTHRPLLQMGGHFDHMVDSPISGDSSYQFRSIGRPVLITNQAFRPGRMLPNPAFSWSGANLPASSRTCFCTSIAWIKKWACCHLQQTPLAFRFTRSVQWMLMYNEHLVSVRLSPSRPSLKIAQPGHYHAAGSFHWPTEPHTFMHSPCQAWNPWNGKWERLHTFREYTFPLAALTSPGVTCLTYMQPHLRMGGQLDQMVGIYGTGQAY